MSKNVNIFMVLRTIYNLQREDGPLYQLTKYEASKVPLDFSKDLLQNWSDSKHGFSPNQDQQSLRSLRMVCREAYEYLFRFADDHQYLIFQDALYSAGGVLASSSVAGFEIDKRNYRCNAVLLGFITDTSHISNFRITAFHPNLPLLAFVSGFGGERGSCVQVWNFRSCEPRFSFAPFDIYANKVPDSNSRILRSLEWVF